MLGKLPLEYVKKGLHDSLIYRLMLRHHSARLTVWLADSGLGFRNAGQWAGIVMSHLLLTADDFRKTGDEPRMPAVSSWALAMRCESVMGSPGAFMQVW
ncbi:MAG: hypothetical protein Q4B13_10155 [Lautropia sp.]|nr:hypothetical protein [Lautropia sp.]